MNKINVSSCQDRGLQEQEVLRANKAMFLTPQINKNAPDLLPEIDPFRKDSARGRNPSNEAGDENYVLHQVVVMY